MSKSILLFLTLFNINLFSTGFTTDAECNQTINRAQLSICYNYATKEAKYVTYYATNDQVKKKMSRLSFKEDPEIPVEYRAYNSDYYKSGKDKFHLCPDNIMDFNKTALMATYYLSNVVPGDPYTNRYRWTRIEKLETKYYENHDISYSITGTIYTKQGINGTVGKHKIAIPDYFYKCFTATGNDIQCYIMTNRKTETSKSKTETDYKVTLEHLNSVLPYTIKFKK